MAKLPSRTTRHDRLSYRPNQWPGQRICNEVLITTDEWLCTCVLPPNHAGEHLPSPYRQGFDQ